MGRYSVSLVWLLALGGSAVSASGSGLAALQEVRSQLSRAAHPLAAGTASQSVDVAIGAVAGMAGTAKIAGIRLAGELAILLAHRFGEYREGKRLVDALATQMNSLAADGVPHAALAAAGLASSAAHLTRKTDGENLVADDQLAVDAATLLVGGADPRDVYSSTDPTPVTSPQGF